MANPAKSATDIDWDKMAKRLGKQFDLAMTSAEDAEYMDEEYFQALSTAARTSDALVNIAEHLRATNDSTKRAPALISKPEAK